MRVKECVGANPVPTTPARVPNLPRRFVLFTTLVASCSSVGPALANDQEQPQLMPPAETPSELLAFAENISKLEGEANEAYARRDFKRAVDKLSELMYQQPYSARWSEMRAQVLVDGKNFSAAIMDYNEAMSRTSEADSLSQARLLAGRALALEGEEAWTKALADYQQASAIADLAGEQEDPFIVNSIGNCHASLGQWTEARAAYQRSAADFQKASGFRDTTGLSAGRSTAAALAQSNAALALVQLGDIPGAIRELQYVSRRQGGFVDSRAALAALYYDIGKVEEAEKVWEYACDNISVGCSKYRDIEWVRKVRRWPPVMSQKLQSFVQLSSQQGAAGDVGQPQAVASVTARPVLFSTTRPILFKTCSRPGSGFVYNR